MDNYAAHKRVEVRNWLTANPRIKVHFTPTSGSWLNLVEVWFGIIERQAIRRGTFVSVRELIGKIREFINSWNNRKHPFIWTKTPDEILAKINRKRKLGVLHVLWTVTKNRFNRTCEVKSVLCPHPSTASLDRKSVV